jgi:hypothetical protein
MLAHPLLRPACQFLTALSALGYLGALLSRAEHGGVLAALAAFAVSGSVGFGLGRIARAAR